MFEGKMMRKTQEMFQIKRKGDLNHLYFSGQFQMIRIDLDEDPHEPIFYFIIEEKIAYYQHIFVTYSKLTNQLNINYLAI